MTGKKMIATQLVRLAQELTAEKLTAGGTGERNIVERLFKLAKSITAFETITIAYPMGNGFPKLQRLDESFMGTPNYMGIAYFWHSAYRHGLRAASPVKRRQVHDAFLKAGLDLVGESELHEDILRRLKAL